MYLLQIDRGTALAILGMSILALIIFGLIIHWAVRADITVKKIRAILGLGERCSNYSTGIVGSNKVVYISSVGNSPYLLWETYSF